MRGYTDILFLALATVFGILLAGGLTIINNNPQPTNSNYIAVPPAPFNMHKSLQLGTFGFTTPVPTPSLCQNTSVNEEPWILLGYSPSQGQTVSANGQVKVWVSDEAPPCVGTGETVDANGLITTRGNTTEKAPDGYLWEPALYVDTFAESGGIPHFPDYIKGIFNNGPKSGGSCENLYNLLNGRGVSGIGVNGPPMDPAPPHPPPQEPEAQDEYIWNVSSLGLTTGTHQAEFIIHDGDVQHGIGCVNITIQ